MNKISMDLQIGKNNILIIQQIFFFKLKKQWNRTKMKTKYDISTEEN